MSGLRSVLSNPKARVGVILVVLMVLSAVIGPLFAQDPLAFQSEPLQPPSASHWMGTTGMGQDVLSQTLLGGRITLAVAFAAGLGVVVIGALVGGAAGYFGGRVDDALSMLINVFLVMPGLPLMVVLAAWLPTGPLTMLGVLVLTGWAWNARVLRSQVLTLRQRDFVAAAVVSGEPSWRVIVVEILPNMGSLLASAWIGATVYAIGAQVGLEFLGLGDLNSVTWGTNLYWATNDSALLTGSWWTFVPTGLCIAITGFAMTLINFGIDEITNPRLAASNEQVGPPRSTEVLHIDEEVSAG